MGIKDISICITHPLSRFCRFEIDSQYNSSGINLEILSYHEIWRLSFVERELCKCAINLFNGPIVILWSLIVLSCPVRCGWKAAMNQMQEIGCVTFCLRESVRTPTLWSNLIQAHLSKKEEKKT